MTIRDLQYAIQLAIDENDMSDNAKVKVCKNKDGEIEIFAVENRIENGKYNSIKQYCQETLLGRV
jgi:hypothetical protein